MYTDVMPCGKGEEECPMSEKGKKCVQCKDYLMSTSSEVAAEKISSPPHRLCTKCREYFPVACFLLEDGTDDLTLCNRHEPAKKGLRYCRGCKDFVALDLFPKGPKQFACRKHMGRFGGVKESKRKQMANPEIKRRTQQWHRCYQDGKKFEHSLPSMGQAEIEIAIRKVVSKDAEKYYVMPVDVNIKTSSENAVVVTHDQRKRLLKLFDSGDVAEYQRVVGEIQSSYT